MEMAYLDILAPAWFFALWVGYSVLADREGEKGGKPNLVNAMHRFRLQWVKNMIRREDRIADIRTIGNLLESTKFLASTSIFIIAGLVAIMAYGELAMPIIGELPFAVANNQQMWIIKTATLLVIFIYSFFKFTWVIRQYNYASVLVLAAPVYNPDEDERTEMQKEIKYIFKTATMLSNAARHFNMGVRSYYFGLVALSWYVNPLFFIFMSILVIVVLYRREYRSKTLVLLS